MYFSASALLRQGHYHAIQENAASFTNIKKTGLNPIRLDHNLTFPQKWYITYLAKGLLDSALHSGRNGI